MQQRPGLRRATTLLVGTTNAHKIAEIREALSELSLPSGETLRVVGAEGLPKGEPIEETGSTFEENAAIKARGYAQRALRMQATLQPTWVIADDSGLCVKALDGAPGVLSARYAESADSGREDPERSQQDKANNAKLLASLSDSPQDQRGAAFVCVMACVRMPPPPVGNSRADNEDSEDHSAADSQATEELKVLFFSRGECRGHIVSEPRGEEGFGYDPLFFYAPLKKTFAELTRGEKNRVSHRGGALAQLKKRMLELIQTEANESSPPEQGPEG